jgi:hypothetical protein
MMIATVGERSPAAVHVDFHASVDTQITESDYLLGRVVVIPCLNGSAMVTLRCTFPTGIPAGTYHVGWIIDPQNVENETDEGNNTASNASSLLTVVEAPRQAVIYVDATARGAGAGSSWEDAFDNLQDALAAASMGCEIHMAGGVYPPDRGLGVVPGDRGATFGLKDGVKILGGYAGVGMPDPDTRNPAIYRTILTGDLSGDDLPVADPLDWWIEASRMDNSRHVVTAIDAGPATLLDGLCIMDGYADGRFENASTEDSQGAGMYVSGGGPRLQGCVFAGNWAVCNGGAVYVADSRPEFLHCTFCENAAGASPNICRGAGGAIFSTGSSLTLAGCTLNGNSSTGSGGAVANSGGSLSAVNCCLHANHSSVSAGAIHLFNGGLASLTNCTIAANRQSPYAGAIVCESSVGSGSSEMYLANCILWNDDRDVVSWGASAVTVACSNVRNGWFDGDNLRVEPRFVDPAGPDGLPGTADDDLRLRGDSLCVDAGNSNLLPADAADVDGDGDVLESLPLDRDGARRVVGDSVDLGAYEVQ